MHVPRGNPFINGVLYSWSSIEFEGNGLDIEGIKAISYKDNLAGGEVMGTGSVARGSTLGKYKASGSIEIYRDAFDEFVLAIGGPGFYARFIKMSVSRFEPALGVRTDIIVPRIGGTDISDESSSSDGSTTKHDLFIITPILFNGIPGVPIL